MFILDSHCDTPSQIVRGRDLSIDNVHGHVDFPKLKRGGVSASFFALFTSAALNNDEAYTYASHMLDAVKGSVAKNPELVQMAETVSEIKDNYAKGLISIILGMENGSPIGTSLEKLQEFYNKGVRYLTLAHNGDNDICDSAAEGKRWHGLSPFGREVVAMMNKLGMLIDVAHISDEAFYDCIRLSKAPIVTTHSCCRALASHRRNLTDDMLRALAENGGVAQINFYPAFLSDEFARVLTESKLDDKADEIEAIWIADTANSDKFNDWINVQEELKKLPRPGVESVVDHIDHAVKIAGVDHVGIGTDFDGIIVPPAELEDISMLGKVFDEMKNRGYKKEEIEKIAGLNFLRVLQQVEQIAE